MRDDYETYTVVNVYDPSSPERVRQMRVECYMREGRDMTEAVVMAHTKALTEVAAYKLALANIKKYINATRSYELEALDRMLCLATEELDLLEYKWPGLANYRMYRTPYTNR